MPKNNNMKNASLFFFLMSLFLLPKAASADSKPSKQLQTRELRDPTEIEVCPNVAGMSTLFPVRTSYPVIDESFVMRLCKRNIPTKTQRLIAKAFMEARKDPWVAELIDLVLLNAPKFSITLDSHLGDYPYPFPSGMTEGWELYLSPNIIADNPVLAIRHEMLHAFMLLANSIRSGHLSESMHCFYPNTPQEKAKFLQCIEDDRKKIEHLRELLNKEKNGQLSSKETGELAKWQKLADGVTGQDTDGAGRFYFTVPVELNEGNRKWIEEFTSGKVKHIRFPDNTFVDHPYTTFLKSVTIQGNKANITVYVRDPLWSVIATYDRTQLSLRQTSVSDHGLEVEYVPLIFEGRYPPSLRAEFFPSLFNHVNLLKEAVQRELAYHPAVPSSFFPGYKHHFEIVADRLLTWSSYCIIDNAEAILDEIHRHTLLQEKYKYNECEHAALTLINKGFSKGITKVANVWLGTLYSHKHQDEKAFKKFNTAFRHKAWKATLPSGRTVRFDDDHTQYHYARSAYYSGHFKLAKKLCNKLLKQNERREPQSSARIEFERNQYEEQCNYIKNSIDNSAKKARQIT